MKLSTLSLDHLGLVAAIIDALGISELIDGLIPKTRECKLSHSELIKALILNGLGFVERRLYIFPSYFENLALERLFHPGVVSADFNEDAIGRTLDRINRYGSTKLFNQIAMQCMRKLSIGTQIYHVDTTSFSVHGDYEGLDCMPAIEITLGHPKDGRWDLNQFIISMITNQCGIPLFVKAHSGNKSDKKTIIETIQAFKSNLDFSEKGYFAADSAFFSSENIRLLGNETLWITHVPSTVGEVKDFLKCDLDMKTCSDDRYSIFETEINYGGIDQKWVVIDSREMHASKAKTFDKRIDKEFTETKNSLKKMGRIIFVAKPMLERQPKDGYRKILISSFKIKINAFFKRKASQRGRPKKDEELERGFRIEAEIERNELTIANERARLGRFILASNDKELDGELMPKYYKGQNVVEKGFRFLKDKSFRVAEVYLKKVERIEALSMIMALSLLIYSIAEWMIRQKLKEYSETVLNQLGNHTARPTLKWIFQKFRNINEAIFEFKGAIQREVINLNDEQIKIIKFLGKECEKYYV